MSGVSLCRDPDGTTPCPFTGVCPERRQRIAAGYALFGGGSYSKVPMYPPLRGNACCWYQREAIRHPAMLPAIEVDLERQAIQDEGEAA